MIVTSGAAHLTGIFPDVAVYNRSFQTNPWTAKSAVCIEMRSSTSWHVLASEGVGGCCT